MILQGPPLPAPPAFLGIAVAGLGISRLLRERARNERVPNALSDLRRPRQMGLAVVERPDARDGARSGSTRCRSGGSSAKSNGRFLRRSRSADAAARPRGAGADRPRGSTTCCTQTAPGYRYADMPPMREAWRQGLTRSLPKRATATARASRSCAAGRTSCCATLQHNRVESRYWRDLPAGRLLHRITAEGGRRDLLFAPRRLERDRFRRPGEPPRLRPPRLRRARPVGSRRGRARPMLEVAEPRAVDGRAPDVFRQGKWVPMRSYADEEESTSRSSAPALAAGRSPASSRKPAFPSSHSTPGHSGGRSRTSSPTSGRRAAPWPIVSLLSSNIAGAGEPRPAGVPGDVDDEVAERGVVVDAEALLLELADDRVGDHDVPGVVPRRGVGAEVEHVLVVGVACVEHEATEQRERRVRASAPSVTVVALDRLGRRCCPAYMRVIDTSAVALSEMPRRWCSGSCHRCR